MSIPETIRQKKPTQFGAVEIRRIGGHYYIYLVSSRWDARKQRPQKVTGRSIGKITEADGFIPNANGLRLMQSMRLTPDIAPSVKNYGAYETLQQLSPDLNEQLKKHFPEMFREIRTISLLRLVDRISSVRMIQPIFLDSYMSDICADIAVSENSARRFVSELGSKQDRQDAFMRDQVMPGSTLLLDGTSIFMRGADSLADKGYNPDHSLDPQARILYVFEKNSHRPVFYRVVQGSIVDKTVYENNDDNKWDDVFPYNKRAIWCRKKLSGNKGNFIYTFRDDSRRAELVGHYVEHVEKDYGEEEHIPKDVIRQIRMGYFSFCSNLDLPAKEIYLDYKERWDIEQCFDYLKNSVISSASHAHTDDYFRGWAFLNHISLLYYYGLLNALRNAGLTDKFSAKDVLKLTKNIYCVDTGDKQGFKVSAIQKKTKNVLDTLGVDLLRKI